MDRSKQRGGIANDVSYGATEHDGDLFENSSKAASHGGEENFVNEYAEASQAREASRSPRPIELPQSFRANSSTGANEREKVSTIEPLATEIRNQVADTETMSVQVTPSKPDDHARQTTAVIIPRLMTVKEVASYTRLSVTKVWRRGGNDPDFPQPIKINGSTRWDRLEVDRYVEACKARRPNGR